MKNLGIYIRKSRESENQKSLKEQRLLGIEFCTENNYNPIFYNDGIVSGAGSTDKRPQYNQMLSDIADGKLYGIYIWNTDRTARDEIAWQTLANLLKDNNVFLFDNGTKADFSDKNTLLFYTIKSGMDAYFSRVTSSKIKAVIGRNAKEGKFSGILKYGYKRDNNGKTIVDTDEAEVVKMIFQLCIDGKGYKAIAEYLNDNNIPTRYNKIGGSYLKDSNLHGKQSNIKTKSKEDAKWVSAVIGKILRSRNYIGEKTFNGNIMNVPKIVNLTTFNKAQDRIDKRLNKHGKKSFKKYLLNDILICSNCGKRYTGRKVNKFEYYRCASGIVKGASCGSSGIRQDFLDNLVWRFFFYDKYFLTMIYNQLNEAKTQPKASTIKNDITTLKSSLKAKEKELANVTKYLIQEVIKQDEATTQLNRIRIEISDIELKIERNTETLNSLSTIESKFEDYQAEINNLKETTPFDKKKEIVERHLKQIKIINKDGYFTIDLEFKTFNKVERYIVTKNYVIHEGIDIDFDKEVREQGFLNVVDWGNKRFAKFN